MYVYKSVAESRVTNAHHIIHSLDHAAQRGATPRNSDAHKRIAVPKALCVLREHPDQDPKAAKFAVLIPGPGMFENVRNARG